MCRAELSGGAITLRHSDDASLENCQFEFNAAAFGELVPDQGGGGILIRQSKRVLLESCGFVGNTAGATLGSRSSTDGKGGGMRVQKGIGIVIRNTSFVRNRAQGEEVYDPEEPGFANGGGLHVESSGVRLDDCTLAQNVASNQGGGIWGDVSSSTMVVNTTLLYGNMATWGSGAGVYIAGVQSQKAALKSRTQIISSCIIDNKVCCLLQSG